MSPSSVVETNSPVAPKSRIAKGLLQVGAFFLWWIGSLFLAAGRLDWVRGWISVALVVVAMPAVGLIIQRYNAPVLEARSKWRHQKDTARFDKIFLGIYGPLISILPALAGLDAGRYHWTSLPFGFVYVGSILFASAMALITWVMVVNPFAEKTVRIQTDRGQTVITSGPYRYVRHPMYVGLTLLFVSTALVWGSVWALRLDAVMAVVLIWRTALEDRTLRQKLAGYEQYAAVTRYRLLPGLW
jgi:protein-S-isoprenylcysteine O-methyltransferase Ste14